MNLTHAISRHVKWTLLIFSAFVLGITVLACSNPVLGSAPTPAAPTPVVPAHLSHLVESQWTTIQQAGEKPYLELGAYHATTGRGSRHGHATLFVICLDKYYYPVPSIAWDAIISQSEDIAVYLEWSDDKEWEGKSYSWVLSDSRKEMFLPTYAASVEFLNRLDENTHLHVRARGLNGAESDFGIAMFNTAGSQEALAGLTDTCEVMR